jgi:serine/threonine protein kinase
MMIGLGRYNLLTKLGQGGMGTVYLARQKNLRRYCAIKLVNPQLSQDKSSAERFLREARATASLSHPNLVQVFDCDEYDGQCFLAMEYIEGKTLGQILREQGGLPLPLAFFWLNQASVGLQYLHEKSIVHRDIKPDNMVIDATGNLKLMDLGLAKDHFEQDNGMTMTGTVMGSPHYMSPEQIHDSKTADYRTDIYSLGICLYQMIVGVVPFRHTSAAAICVAHLQEPIPSLGFEDADLTFSLDSLISKMAAKNKDERFQSVAELISILQSWIESYPLDEASQEIFKKLGLDDFKVSNLLARDNINETEVDADLDSLKNQKQSDEEQDENTEQESKSSYLSIIFGVVFLCMVAVAAALYLPGKLSKKETGSTGNTKPATLPPKPPLTKTGPATLPVASTIPQIVPVKFGSLLVKTQPSHALVEFQSQIDKGPAAFNNITPGTYSMKVSMDGYRDEERKIVVKEGRNEVDVSLVQIPGTLKIASTPPGAQVLIDRKLFSNTPCEIPGAHGEEVEVIIHLDGFYDENFKSTLSKEGPLHRITLRPIPREPDVRPVPTEPMQITKSELEEKLKETFENQKLQQITTYIGLKLEDGHAARNFDWPRKKKEILMEFENKFRQSSSASNLDVTRALNAISIDLDNMRRMTDQQFHEKKSEIVNSILRECAKILPQK